MAALRTLTHAQKVTRLYRKSLKHLLSWTIARDVWREQAIDLRDRFDDNKHVDLALAMKLLEQGEKEFEKHKHPDPYIGKLPCRVCTRGGFPDGCGLVIVSIFVCM